MRTFADLQDNFIQLRSSLFISSGEIKVKDLEQRIINIERTIVVMHQLMVQNLQHEIYVRKELTGEK